MSAITEARPNAPRILSPDEIAAVCAYAKGVGPAPRDPELRAMAERMKESDRRRQRELAAKPCRIRIKSDEERERDRYRAGDPERRERTWMDEENAYLDRMEARR